LNLSGLRNAERDEVRSLALLHSFAAAAKLNSGSSVSSRDDADSSIEGLSLELACEPQALLDVPVAVGQLQLPPQMVPSSCSVARFVRSYRCGLLVKGKDSENARVSSAGLKFACVKEHDSPWWAFRV
jgi:hypothetical protein